MTAIDGFFAGLVIGAFGLAFMACGYAFRALVKVEAFENSTHAVEWVPVDRAEEARKSARRKPLPLTGDEETDEALDNALADAEEREHDELEGPTGVHYRQGPLL